MTAPLFNNPKSVIRPIWVYWCTLGERHAVSFVQCAEVDAVEADALAAQGIVEEAYERRPVDL